jgi:hypothetical protein
MLHISYVRVTKGAVAYGSKTRFFASRGFVVEKARVLEENWRRYERRINGESSIGERIVILSLMCRRLWCLTEVRRGAIFCISKL